MFMRTTLTLDDDVLKAARRRARDQDRPLRVSVKEGKLLYESRTSSGTLTVQGDGPNRRLRYEGQSRQGASVGAVLSPAE